MFTSVPGVYRKGKIELEQQPKNITDETRVIVTFLNSGSVNLRKRGFTKKQTEQLREQLSSFAEEWESPEMSAYDDYDAAKSGD
jgi:hypothetical protein